jgi:CBS domain-containing protein
MHMTNRTPKPTTQEITDRLRSARDEARLQLHLLSLEARQRVQGIEANMDALENRLAHEGEALAGSLALHARELSQALSEVLREVDGSRELMTPAENLMTEAPSSCRPEDSLNRAAQIMWECDCGAVPVVDADNRLIGIVTDRDLAMAAYTRGQPLTAMDVASTMSKQVYSANLVEPLGAVLRLMREHQVRRVPITNGGRLVGMVTLADAARHIRNRAALSLPANLALARTVGDVSAPGTKEGAAQAAE